MLSSDILCSHLIGIIHGPIRVCDQRGRRQKVYMDHGEQQDPLECDPDFEKSLLAKGEEKPGVLYLEQEEALYGIVTGQKGERYIAGPCLISTEKPYLNKKLQELHKMDKERPYRISFCEFNVFTECVALLYNQCREDRIDVSQLLLEDFYREDQRKRVQNKIQQTFYEYQEQGRLHNPYSQERREQGSIRQGDMEGLKRSFQETYVGQTGTMAKDPVRNMKNGGIVVITLACRSAIEGGIHPEIAFSVSDAYIQRIEEMNNYGEIAATARQAEMYYARLVRDHKAESQNENALLVRCKTEILQRLHQKITVRELAEILKVNPNYLSQAFGKAEGISLSDYINREKIRFARQRLAYSEDSYGAVAFSFGYSSQSHFGKVFKKWTGMTPQQYRRLYGGGKEDVLTEAKEKTPSGDKE